MPDHAPNPILAAVGRAGRRRLDGASASRSTIVEADPAIIAADQLRTGDFTAAVVSIAIGHDPDLYPLLASTQTRTGGANVFGLQDATARQPPRGGPATGARSAPGWPPSARSSSALATGSYVLPIAWPDTVVVLGPTGRRTGRTGPFRTGRSDSGMC